MPGDLSHSDLIMLATGALAATACALLGTFLVLRRMALVGDAISHAILPGIAIGFLLTHSRHSLVMVLGAAAAGLVTVWLVETLYRTRRLYEDTAIAVVFPALFALGVILMHRYARYVDLDPKCVILGAIELADVRSLGLLLGAVVLNLVLVVFFYRPLKLGTFDPALALALGFSPTLIHYLLMSAVSLTTVASFQAVGAILVVALLIVPPATAYLLTDRLWLMLLLAVGFGVLAAVSGWFVATRLLDSSVAASMATMAGAWFGLVWLVAPRHGLLATLLRRRRLQRQFAADLFLVHLQSVANPSEVAALCRDRLHWSPRYGERLLRRLLVRGLVDRQGDRLRLTPAGEAALRELTAVGSGRPASSNTTTLPAVSVASPKQP